MSHNIGQFFEERICRLSVFNGRRSEAGELVAAVQDYVDSVMARNAATVGSIHKLGEQRPKKLGERPAWEAWQLQDGDVVYHDGCGQVYNITPGNDPCGVRQASESPDTAILTPNCICLGSIEGIVINVKVYSKGAE